MEFFFPIVVSIPFVPLHYWCLLSTGRSPLIVRMTSYLGAFGVGLCMGVISKLMLGFAGLPAILVAVALLAHWLVGRAITRTYAGSVLALQRTAGDLAGSRNGVAESRNGQQHQ